MNGHILPGTNIAVDFWKIRGKRQNLIHFLTHLHGDHIVGLTSSWSKPIYCSEITAQLLASHHGISCRLLEVCPLNESKSVSSSQNFVVTAYDANHCPGAVMFFFQGPFGNILYTGDFRSCPSIIENCRYLSARYQIDSLYLDNTFCDPKCTFPSQEECYKKIVDIARQYPNHDIIIGIRKLGKEFLLTKLGEELQETICTSPSYYDKVNILYSTHMFTTKPLSDGHCRLRTVPMQQITRWYMKQLNEKRPTIAIIPTAIYTGLDCQPFCRDPNVFIIPYSDHSSYPELVQFVGALRPKKIWPIVTDTRGPFGLDVSSRVDMSCFSALLSSSCEVSGDAPIFHSREQSALLTENSFDMQNCPSTGNDEMQYWNTGCANEWETQKNYHSLTENFDVGFQKNKIRKRKSSDWYGLKQLKKRPTGVVYENICSDNSEENFNTKTNVAPSYETTDSMPQTDRGLLPKCTAEIEKSHLSTVEKSQCCVANPGTLAQIRCKYNSKTRDKSCDNKSVSSDETVGCTDNSEDVMILESVDGHGGIRTQTYSESFQTTSKNEHKSLNTLGSVNEFNSHLHGNGTSDHHRTESGAETCVKSRGNRKSPPENRQHITQNENSLKTSSLKTRPGEDLANHDAVSGRKIMANLQLTSKRSSRLSSDEREGHTGDSKSQVQPVNVPVRNIVMEGLLYSDDSENHDSKPRSCLWNALCANSDRFRELLLKAKSKSTWRSGIRKSSELAHSSRLSTDVLKCDDETVLPSEAELSLASSADILKPEEKTENTEYIAVDDGTDDSDIEINSLLDLTDVPQSEPCLATEQTESRVQEGFLTLSVAEKCISAKSKSTVQVYQCQSTGESSLFQDVNRSSLPSVSDDKDSDTVKTKTNLVCTNDYQGKRIRGICIKEFGNALKSFLNKK